MLALRHHVSRDTARVLAAKGFESSHLLGRHAVSPSRAFSSSSTSLESLAANTMAKAFRQHGHLQADTDPLKLKTIPSIPELHSSNYAPLLEMQLDSGSTGKELYEHLHAAYCSQIGFEFEHLSSEEEKQWLASNVESLNDKFPVSPSELRNAGTSMLMADTLETFLATKFPSFKRYSGEGAESMLPAVNAVLQSAASTQVSDVIIGMPHRGRLALLSGLLEYPAHKMLRKIQSMSEFPKDMTEDHLDDVSSHIAQSVDKHYSGSSVHVSLLHNPSHLEIISAVAAGKARAKTDAGGDAMALTIHGDAAFAGQGCVPESLSLAQLPDFTTNGSIRLIVNNQVGFTTTYPDARSSGYASDVAKGLGIPVFHVNGESIEHVIQTCRLAMAYRQRFHKDVVIDLVTYRRHGHNEVDEPRFTQPKMYANVDQAGRFPQTFMKTLAERNLTTENKTQQLVDSLKSHLEKELQTSKEFEPTSPDAFEKKWSTMSAPSATDLYKQPDTGVDLKKLVDIGVESVTIPDTFKVHPRLQRSHIDARKKMLAEDNIQVDWATAEAMAFGSLLSEGTSVRLSGQDCRRGTFSQRHAAFTDQNTNDMYFPLRHLSSSQARFDVINSHLSELAVMGFEYGYSWEDPKNLVLWEAQFGDFANGAQIVIDQFLASGETKWMRQSGLVLLLPHGYDGVGPDHSSARPERFLQMVNSPALRPTGSGDLFEFNPNMIVAHVTTPANYFHLLRRQQHRDYRKPLVVIGPKTMLRLNEAVSPMEDMDVGSTFQPLLMDPNVQAENKVKRVILCSGKFYYELARENRQRSAHPEETAIVRIEELSPFPLKQVQEAMQAYGKAKEVLWVQEEPMNQGAWSYAKAHLDHVLPKKLPLQYVGRPSLPSTAVGMSKRNAQQTQDIFEQVFGKE